MIISTSRGIDRIDHLDVFLSEDGEAVVGWGMKASGVRARAIARKRGLPFLLLEDGFLRSVARKAPPLSLIVDKLGVYYDARSPSMLERSIAQPCSPEQTYRVHALIKAWCASRVSKYNHAPEYRGNLPERFVLVVDQTFGDASVRCGLADASSFTSMLESALTENPDCTVLVKVHPDIFSHRKAGYFDVEKISGRPRIKVLAENCHPVRLIEEAEAIYTVTSQMGFEGLLWGKKVRCFGMPFYAGWGLTEDELAPPSRRCQTTIEQLVHSALIACPRYVDPEIGQRCEVERILEYISLKRDGMKAEVAVEPTTLWHRIIRRVTSQKQYPYLINR